jgi:23S rRNA (guanosine2251-2'-O)-methyltransferase
MYNKLMRKEMCVVLSDIRSAHNVGSIFRTSDGAGVQTVYLCGITPLPLDKFKRPQKEIAKTALGAEKDIVWKYYSSTLECIAELKKEGWQVVGVEQDERADSIHTRRRRLGVVYVFGNEVAGLTQEVRDACDALVYIPMHGKKESLNVSVCAGIVLFAR